MMALRAVLLLMLATAWLTPYPAPAQGRLKESSKAPSLRHARWIKGQPVRRFEPGTVYVVEFWATWCAPCIQAIPHLTALAQRYEGKVVVVGISIWESFPNPTGEDPLPRVERLVQRMGVQMNYSVAVDDVRGRVARAWMDASGRGTIPTAFVVDQQGRIVWIGHPQAGLEQVVEQVVAGRYDWRTAAQQRQAEARGRAPMAQLMMRINDLRAQKRYQQALGELERAEKRYPADADDIVLMRYETLLYADEAQAYQLARRLMDERFKQNAGALDLMATLILRDDPARPLKSPDYALALELAQRAAQLTEEKNPFILYTLAHALVRQGRLEEALRCQQKAVELWQQQGMSEEVIRDYKARLRQARPE